MFTRVFAVRHAEAKIEIETLQELIFEIVPLNHSKVLDWLVSHGKLDTARGNINSQLVRSNIFDRDNNYNEMVNNM